MVKPWMRRLIILVLTFCVIGSPIVVGAQDVSTHGLPLSKSTTASYQSALPGLRAGFQVISSTASSLVVDIQAPSYNLETSSTGEQLCQVLSADGYYLTAPPGAPGLISAGVMLGIPPGANPSVTLQSMDIVDIPGRIHLCPSPTEVINEGNNGFPVYQGDELLENPALYSFDVFTPTLPVNLSALGMIRSQSVSRLSFSPFQYNPTQQTLTLVRHVRVEIRFGLNDSDVIAQSPVEEGLFEATLRNTLINYEQARSWRLAPLPVIMSSSTVGVKTPTDQPAYKIVVAQDGIYQLTYAALQSAGLPVDTLDPLTFKLLNQGLEIPIFVVGEQDGIFNSSDYLLFYGSKINTKYSNNNVYWLTWGGENGLRMAIMDGTVQGASSPVSFKTTMHLEEDHKYYADRPSGPQLDHWYWYYLDTSSGLTSHDFTFLLQNIDESLLSASLRGLLKGYYANPQHHTRISVNGHLIDDKTWPSTDEYSISVDFPQSYLVEGSNSITLDCPLDGVITVDQVLVNWFELDYTRTFTAENNLLNFRTDQPGLWQFQVSGFTTNSIDVFDISDPAAPARVINGTILQNGSLYQVDFEQQVVGLNRYLALSPSGWLTPLAIIQDNPSSLKDPSNGADYIIISYSDFLDAIQPLASYRITQGFRVKVVDVKDIYDEFDGGVFDPRAIHDFLAYAYTNWTAPAPSFVLLVGDGHYDYKNVYGASGDEFIPPYLGEFDPWIGETASDNRYVTVSGSDILPDMYIGRLPANSVGETTAMVNKILSYEQNPPGGTWNYHLTLVADNADPGGDFPALSDNIADHYLPPQFLTDKIYFGQSPYQNVTDTRAAILNSINQGKLLVSFVGHASTQLWAGENLFSVNSIPSLTNTGKYPFFAPMTCLEGYFIFPRAPGWDYPSLAESVVRVSDKGAIASFSPAGFGLSTGHDILAQGLYEALFNDGDTQFGVATTLAKFFLEANSIGFRDLIDTYNLFGDPATRLNLPPTNAIFWFNLPFVVR